MISSCHKNSIFCIVGDGEPAYAQPGWPTAFFSGVPGMAGTDHPEVNVQPAQHDYSSGLPVFQRVGAAHLHDVDAAPNDIPYFLLPNNTLHQHSPTLGN